MVETSKISRSFVLLLILSVVLFDVQARPINKINGASQMITPLADRPSAGGSGHRSSFEFTCHKLGVQEVIPLAEGQSRGGEGHKSSPGFICHKLGTQEVIPLAEGPSPGGGGHRSCPGCI
ncbi:hypothetical protein TIFTF001_052725 [Ficus carica]|uniref:Uncharacterized protein n=1 Tax=Ficus carica TaxID=3494 RepID=A0AA88JGW6_FICCA|nr:hypothetical protein TIFTF001_052725 [Ficus carica]